MHGSRLVQYKIFFYSFERFASRDRIVIQKNCIFDNQQKIYTIHRINMSGYEKIQKAYAIIFTMPNFGLVCILV